MLYVLRNLLNISTLKIIHLIKKFIYSQDWYKGQLTDEELDALEHPTPKPKTTGGPSRRKHRPTK